MNSKRLEIQKILTLVMFFLMAAIAEGQQQADETKKGQSDRPATRDIHKLRPQFPTDQLITKSEQAIQDGLEYLVNSQNKDGSWGSHDPQMAVLMNFGFKTGNRGSQDAVRTACTAICAEALLYQDNLTTPQRNALDKAIEELLKVRKFAYHPGESFNTWGYGYKLGFLVQLQLADAEGKYSDRIQPAAQSCVDGLLRYQQHTGGWGYYADVLQDFDSMSFNTAFFGLSLYRAKDMGLSIPEGMIIDSAKAVQRQEAPDGSFVYSSSHEKNASGILANLGAGSRTVSSALALFEMGVKNKKALLQAMKIFENGENYLEQGRKLIRPHSAVHQISGYFFFFGYNYASEVATILSDEIPVKRWDRLAWTMLRTQEKDGRWWDTAAAGYGDKWGTGFAILTLQRYLREMDRRGLSKPPQEENESNKDDDEGESDVLEAEASDDKQLATDKGEDDK